MKKLFLLALLFLLPVCASAQLSTVTASSGINQTVTVESAGQFRLVFEAYASWGLTQWYDLVNDPNAATNLLLAYGVGGAPALCATESALSQMTFYGAQDKKLFMRMRGCYLLATAPTMTILASSSSMVAIQTSGHPMDGTQNIDSNITGTVTYYIYPTGKIYVTESVHVTNAQDLSNGGTTDLYYGFAGLNAPGFAGTNPPDSGVGWIRALASQNPWNGSSTTNEHYIFAYWDHTTPTYGNFTKANIMIVLGPNVNAGGSYYAEINHGWSCGAGCGTMRLGYRMVNSPNMTAGQTITQQFMVQLGTENSTILPNLRTTGVCDPIANAFRNSPNITSYFSYVNQGGTLQFVEQEADAGTWTVSGTDSSGGGTAGAGSVNASGLYTAPASVTSQQSLGGYQLLPNSHVFNTRIDSLSPLATANLSLTIIASTGCSRTTNVATVSTSTAPAGGYAVGETLTVTCTGDATFNGTVQIATLPGSCSNLCFTYANAGSNTNVGGGTVSIPWMNQLLATSNGNPNYSFDPPVNYVTSATPTDRMNFKYTTALNDAAFPIPVFPNVFIQSGWWHARSNQTSDHHLFSIATDTGNLAELYQYYGLCTTTAAAVAGNVATLTCTTNPQDYGFTVGGLIGIGSFTGSDTYFNNAYPITITAVTSTTISFALTHADASATSNGTASLSTQNCTTCNSQSGLLYGFSDYALPAGATNAAGTAIEPLSIHLQEFEQAVASSGTINHALAFTLGQGYECSCFVWPATANASVGGFIPYGSRVRLKSAFPIGGFTATQQVILKQLQQYGLINTDGGTMWNTGGDGGRWPTAYINAFNSIASATDNFTITNTALTSNIATITAANNMLPNYKVTISGTSNGSGAYNVSNAIVLSASATQFTIGITHGDVGSGADSGTAAASITSYMEFVDESGMQVAANQTCPVPSACGATTHNREIVTFTRTSDSATANADVALQGVALNLPLDSLNIVAATPAQQLTCLVNIGSCTWTMSPTVGTLTSGGLYTAPGSIGSVTYTTVTATSTANGAVAAQMTLGVFPGPTIRVVPGLGFDFTDSGGHLWTDDSAGITNTGVPNSCCPGPDSSFPSIVDHQLWDTVNYHAGDIFTEFRMPAGTYKVTYRANAFYPVGTEFMKLDTQGSTLLNSTDLAAAVGQHQPYTAIYNIVIVGADNKFQFVTRKVSGSLGISHLSSLSVESAAPATNGISLTSKIKMTSGTKKQ